MKGIRYLLLLLAAIVTQGAWAQEECQHSLIHYESTYNCLYYGTIEYWQCQNCGRSFADEACTIEVDGVGKNAKGSHNFNFSLDADEYHCQEQYCTQVVYGNLTSGVKSISTPDFQNAVSGVGYKATYNYQIYRFVAPRTGMLAIKDISENPVKCTVAVFDANWKYLTYNSASQYSSEGVGLYYQVTAGREYFIGIRATATNTPLDNEIFKFRVNCTRHNNGTSVAGVEPTCEHEGVKEHFICDDCGGIYDYQGDYVDHDESRYVLAKTPHRLYNGECKVCHTKVPTYEPGEYQITLDNNHMESWGSTCTIFRVHTENHGLLTIAGESDDSNFSFSIVHPSYVEEAESNNGGGALSAPRKANNVADSKTVLMPGNGYYYVKVYGDDAAIATFNIALEEHPIECEQEHVEPTCTTEGKKAVYCCTGACGSYYRFTEDGIVSPNSSQMTIPTISHEIGENGVCTMCGHKIVLTDGDNDVQFLAGYQKATIFKFTATETGRVELAVETNANILYAGIYPWSEGGSQNGGTPASAPRKAAPVDDPTNPYTVSGDVVAGNEYSVVFVTSEYNETPASVNVGYYNVYVDGENVDLATAMADHPYAKGLSFGWNANITSCTITKDMMLKLEWGTTFIGQLKIDNGAKVEINGGGNLSFRNMSAGSFSVIVEDGDLTCNYVDNFNYNYNNSAVLVKKGSFTANGGRIHGTEAIVARKSLGSTDDVAINVINGAEVWGTRLAIYMDVNGHLTIDNPGTYQGIQADTQSIVAKAGTIDLSNIKQYGIRNNGPVGAVENRPEPVMHGRIPYLYGVPAVALQVGTSEEGFTGTTTLRMRNVCLPESANGDVDYQLVLITGSATHPTRYYLTNVQGEEQIVVENAQYVEAMEPVVVEDGENDDVLFPDGEAQLTVLKFTATESKLLEVSVATDATIENCFIMPWEEWDVSSAANDDILYARRKASGRAGAAPTGKTVAMTEVNEGNTYAIIFTTTAATKTAATITLSYLDVNLPSEENDYMLAEGKNLLVLEESGYSYNWAEYTFVPEKTGIVTLKCEDTSYLEVWDDDEYDKWTNDDGTILKCVLQEGVVYTVYVETDADVTTAMLTITVEDFDGTLVLDDTKDLAENLGEWRNIDTFTVPEGVVYMRNSTTSRWGTVVLPYELQSNDKVAYYELTAADIPACNLEFTKVETVEPNTPTVFRIISGNQYDASVDGPVTIELPEYLGDFKLYTETKVEDWYLDGWYYRAVIDTKQDDYFMDGEGNPGDPGIMYISGDKFYHATGTVTVKPYRAIFEAYDVDWSAAHAKAMTISFRDGDDVDYIESIMEENGEFTDVEAVYSIDGQRMNGIQRGVNIIRTADGKTRKFIKKQ